MAGGAPAPHTNSGIAAFLRDQNRGYRLYYHDKDMHLNELSYDPDTTTWSWEGAINHDVPGSNAIAAVDGRDQGNFTIFTPRDDKNIQITQWGLDKNWYICKLHHLSASCHPEKLHRHPTPKHHHHHHTNLPHSSIQPPPPIRSRVTSAPAPPPRLHSKSITQPPPTTPSPSGRASPNASASASTRPLSATSTTSAATSPCTASLRKTTSGASRRTSPQPTGRKPTKPTPN